MAPTVLPTFDDVMAAKACLAEFSVRTPLLRFPMLDDATGARVLVKAETLQRMNTFKFRGAYNAVSAVESAQWPGGVTTCSSGNHAQGVAEAARLCGLHATIVMPADAPRTKLARTRRAGAEIVTYDRDTEDRQAIAAQLAEDRQAMFVAPYDDPRIIAGQGTVGLEIVEQAEAAGLAPDCVLVPCGGGGLTAGLSLAIKHLAPETEIYAVEPEDFDDHARSLASGERERNQALSGSICDALLAQTPGELTFALNKTRLAGALTVSDAQVRDAVRFAFDELRLVVEPGGAVALAALLSGRLDVAGRTVAIVLSGGNIDPELFAEIVSARPAGAA